MSVPVDVHAPEEKGAENSPTAPAQPNINIYSDNVRVVYSTNPDGSYTVDLMDSKIIQPEVSAVDQSDNKNEPNWIDYVCMILLALLTFEGLQERIAKRRRV